MAEEYYHVLYSETRRVAYINDEPFNGFWDKYLMNKYKADKWKKFKDNEFVYFGLLSTAKKVNLLDRTDLNARSLVIEIRSVKEKLAIQKLDEEYVFVVLKDTSRGESIVYAGLDANAAVDAFTKNFNCNIEVRQDGRMVNAFYDRESFWEKHIKKTS